MDEAPASKKTPQEQVVTGLTGPADADDKSKEGEKALASTRDADVAAGDVAGVVPERTGDENPLKKSEKTPAGNGDVDASGERAGSTPSLRAA